MSEPNLFVLIVLFVTDDERLRQARMALWSDTNWSVTETEEMRLSGSWAMSQSLM